MKNRTLALEILKLTRSIFSGKRSVRNLQKCNGVRSVKEDGDLADLDLAQPLKYDPFPSIHEDYLDRIEDLLSEVDLEDSAPHAHLAPSFILTNLSS